MTPVAMRTRDCYKAMAAARMVKTYLGLGATSSGARQASCIRGGSTRTQTKQAANGDGDGERDNRGLGVGVGGQRAGQQGRAGRASFRGRWGACEILQQAAPDCRLVLAGRQTRECRQASAEAAGDMALAMHVHLCTCTAVCCLTSYMRITFGCLISFIVDISRLICKRRRKY